MRCKANNRNGVRCYAWSMHGQAVCRMHGGSSPQALRKAEERLRELEFPAITTVAHVMEHGDTDAVRLAAARWLLELLGHRPLVQAQVEQQVTIRLVHEDQPIIIENTYALDGRTHD
jgi:hypothetical protein